jgi:hypothetical protein
MNSEWSAWQEGDLRRFDRLLRRARIDPELNDDFDLACPSRSL